MGPDPLLPDSAFLGQQSFQLSVQPRRRGLLIKHGNEAHLRNAIQGALSVWGGARFPILPVKADGVVEPGWVEIARILAVDEVVDFTDSTTGPRWAEPEAAEFLIRPARTLDDAKFWNPHPVVAADDSIEVREMRLPADDSLTSLAGAGSYGLAAEVPIFRQNGWNILEAASPVSLATAQLSQRTAVAATLTNEFDRSIRGGAMFSAGLLWVTDSRHDEHFDDVVFFWNYRAARPRYLKPAPVDVLVDAITATEPEFVTAFNQHVRASSTSVPAFFINSLTVADADLRALATGFGAALHTDGQFRERWGGREGLDDGSITFGVNQDLLPYWLAERETGLVHSELVHLRRPTTSVAMPSPKTWTPQYHHTSRVVVELSSPMFDVPRRPATAALFHANAAWAMGGPRLRFQVSNQPKYPFNVSLPTAEEVLTAAVGSAGVTYERSDKAQQLLGLMARDNDDLSFYRDPVALFVISALTAKASRDLTRELRYLRETGEVSNDTIEALRTSSLLGSRSPRTIPDLKGLIAEQGLAAGDIPGCIEELTSRGVAEMGLVAVCPLCSLTEYQPLHEIRGGATCHGCGARAVFKANNLGSPDVSFRLSTLAHTVSLNGGLTPLAAHALLVEERSYVVLGVNLFRDGAPIGEVDLLGWKGASLFAGEAKSSARGFELVDAEAEVAKAKSCGADTYLAVCLEELGPETRQRFEDATKKQAMTLRVLDGPALLAHR